jgi:DHA1 family bicyclomycin/chloramphenicol resistance-like MFS transporter
MESYGQLLRAPAFWGYAVGGGCATTSLYGFVAAAPFILVGDLHQPMARVGGYIALLVLGVWVGSILASRLIARVSVGRLLVGANGVSVAAAFILLAIVLSDRLTVPLAFATVFAFSVGVGTAAPAALAEALSVNPRVAPAPPRGSTAPCRWRSAPCARPWPVSDPTRPWPLLSCLPAPASSLKRPSG